MTMPTKSRMLGILVVILLITNVAMLVFFVFLKPTPPQGQNRAKRGGYDVTVFLEKEVGFTKAQMAAYDSLRTQHWNTMKPNFNGMRIAKDSFYQQLYRASVADSVINAYGDSIALKQKAIDMQVFRHFQQVRNLCTDDQRPKFDSLINQVIRKMSGPYKRDKPEQNDSIKVKPN